ncbi:MAG: hypothetical protein H8D23_18790 [Candidatus Brocadiales bacterium]|nr:hypothetical protein [Candidatus Brocadiales bacterium]
MKKPYKTYKDTCTDCGKNWRACTCGTGLMESETHAAPRVNYPNIKTFKRQDGTKGAFYPTCCTSAYCGRVECSGCEFKHILDEFKQWRKDTGAKCIDNIWSPLIYTIPNNS